MTLITNKLSLVWKLLWHFFCLVSLNALLCYYIKLSWKSLLMHLLTAQFAGCKVLYYIHFMSKNFNLIGSGQAFNISKSLSVNMACLHLVVWLLWMQMICSKYTSWSRVRAGDITLIITWRQSQYIMLLWVPLSTVVVIFYCFYVTLSHIVAISNKWLPADSTGIGPQHKIGFYAAVHG